jgi:hypothetical protein
MQPRRLLTTGTITAVVLGLILGVLNTSKAEAQFNIAGIYIVARSPDEGPSRILKINSDGTLTSIQSTQLGLGVGDTTFSNQMGVWIPVGPQTIHASVFDFVYDVEVFFGTTIASYTLEFSADFQKVTGVVKGSIFAPGVNPLKPHGEAPLLTFTDNFVAKRAHANSAQPTPSK